MDRRSRPSAKKDEFVLLGRIVGAHGLRGEVKIAAFTGKPEDIAAYGTLVNRDGTCQFDFVSHRSTGGGSVIARLRGISNRNAAENLRGIDLFVASEALTALEEEDEYYHSELIGLQAVSADGEAIGEVIAVHNFGAGDLLDIRVIGERQSQLIPFDGAHVPHVDLAGGRVTIVKPVYEQGESGSAV